MPVPSQHHAQPDGHAPVEAAREQIDGEGPGRDEKRPDPDRPVVQSIADLVSRADGALGVELDPLGVPELQRPAGGHQRAERFAKRVAILTRHSSTIRSL